MGKLVQSVVWTVLFAVQPLFAQEEKKTQPAPATGRSGIADFFAGLEWWFWLLLVGLLVLIGVFFYLRNKQAE